MSKWSDPDLEHLDVDPTKFIPDPYPEHSVSSVEVTLRGESGFFVYQNISGRMSNKLSCLRFVCICVAASAVLTFFLNAASISDKELLRLQLVQTWNVFKFFL